MRSSLLFGENIMTDLSTENPEQETDANDSDGAALSLLAAKREAAAAQ